MNSRLKRYLLLLIGFSFCSSIVFQFKNLQSSTSLSNTVITSTKKPYIKKYRGMPDKYNMKRKTKSLKKLVLFFNRPVDWTGGFETCEVNNCEYTYDKRDYFISDVILFFAPSLDRNVKDLPPKPKGQIWVYVSQEPPSEVHCNFRNWKNVFNWTYSNRRDSDLYVPYGEVEVHKNERYRTINYSETFKMKNKTAFWFVSHCKTQSRREDYVKLLQKYIDIDVLGRCSSNGTKRDRRNKFDLANFYKFHISFENSLCKDYITEKILHILPASIVPIVRGEPTTDLFLPPGSYIDAKNFNSASTLGKYLAEMQYNKTEYIKYLEWKRHYRVFQYALKGTCSLCKLLNKAQKHQRLYNDIDAWVNNPADKPLCNTNPQDLHR